MERMEDPRHRRGDSLRDYVLGFPRIQELEGPYRSRLREGLRRPELEGAYSDRLLEAASLLAAPQSHIAPGPLKARSVGPGPQEWPGTQACVLGCRAPTPPPAGMLMPAGSELQSRASAGHSSTY